MDFATLKATLLRRLNMSTDDPAADQVGDLVNEGLHLVEISHPNGWPYLSRVSHFSTSATVQSYSFASVQTSYDLMKVQSVKVLSSQRWAPLTAMSVEEADSTFTASTTTGLPQGFHVEGEQVYLFPTPDAAYDVQVRGVIAEPDLVSSTSEPLMPASFHGSIIAAGMTLYYETLQDTNRAQAAAQRLDGWVNKMLTASREDTVPPRLHLRDW